MSLPLNNLLTAINVGNEFDQENNEMTLDATGPVSTTADSILVSKMWASIAVMGVTSCLLGHARTCQVAVPRGLGPIDPSISCFEALGKITRAAGYVEAQADKLGKVFTLTSQVWALTSDTMMAAVLAEGTTI